MRLTRVYNNGDRVTDLHSHVEGWRAYNEANRPGCALFINGECIQRGYLNDQQIAHAQQYEQQNLQPISERRLHASTYYTQWPFATV